MYTPGRSFPSRGRGLKFSTIESLAAAIDVVPLAGTWVEIVIDTHPLAGTAVVPLAGTWVEIAIYKSVYRKRIVSFPSRGGGLKCVKHFLYLLRHLVVPLAGTWVEISTLIGDKSLATGRSPRGDVG